MKGTELIDRIRDEMAAAKNGYIDMMGEMMTEYLRLHPETEIDDKKNLKGACAALRSTAQKKQKGGCYAMPPREVFAGMMDYFTLPHADADFRACMAAVIGQNISDSPAAEMAGAGVSEICGAISRRHEDDVRRDNIADDFDLDALLEVENPPRLGV